MMSEQQLEQLGQEKLQQKVEELQEKLYKQRYCATIRSTVGILLCVAAVIVLLVNLWFPVLIVSSDTMEPTLTRNNLVLGMRSRSYDPGDIIVFYSAGQTQIKRVIASEADMVDIDQDGNVTVNGQALDEPYLTKKALGQCDIKLPSQVPQKSYFVMGDNRIASVDSRSTSMGVVSEEQIRGKLLVRLWPFQMMR